MASLLCYLQPLEGQHLQIADRRLNVHMVSQPAGDVATAIVFKAVMCL